MGYNECFLLVLLFVVGVVCVPVVHQKVRVFAVSQPLSLTTLSRLPSPVLSCLVLPCLSCLVSPCLILSCLVLSCLVLSCLVLSFLVLSCPVLSCPALSYLSLSRPCCHCSCSFACLLSSVLLSVLSLQGGINTVGRYIYPPPPFFLGVPDISQLDMKAQIDKVHLYRRVL